jgi:hypothetical protein
MLPKLYEIKHPSTPYQVVFTDPRGKRIRRHFSVKSEAEKYHVALLSKSKIAGTAGLVLDAEMRAEYFAARRALEGVPIMTAVRHYLSKAGRVIVVMSDGTRREFGEPGLDLVAINRIVMNGRTYYIKPHAGVPPSGRQEKSLAAKETVSPAPALPDAGSKPDTFPTRKKFPSVFTGPPSVPRSKAD